MSVHAHPYSPPTRSRWPLALLASLSFTLIACDGGSADPVGTTCSRDSDCGADSYCDLGGASMDLDDECLRSCFEMCPPGDGPCAVACAESCETNPAELSNCTDLCGIVCEGEPACESECFAGCEDGSTSDPDPEEPAPSGPSGSGTCRPRSPVSPPTDGGSPTMPTQDAGTMPQPIDWLGTWSARVTYTAKCQWSSAGAPNTANLDYTVTAELSGSNSSVSAVFSGNSAYTMTGPGNATRLSLSGPFPGRDHNNNPATTVARNNTVTIVLDEIATHNEVRGRIEGSYETSGGIECQIQSGGRVELTR